ncbi:hypothetical protein [Xanthobacter autotrophicus]|uniref:hypothetical protein n=1 Tax=Xanthobacter autotrophicus TaxID=280 RepID=UPI003727F116
MFSLKPTHHSPPALSSAGFPGEATAGQIEGGGALAKGCNRRLKVLSSLQNIAQAEIFQAFIHKNCNPGFNAEISYDILGNAARHNWYWACQGESNA